MRQAHTSSAVAVSVAVCTYNGERHLNAQLDSILAQSVRPDQIVVSDDGSTDATRNILQRFSDKNPGLFELHFQQTSLGAVKNFEFALRQCRGEIIFLSDQDDVWRPEKVFRMCAAFSRMERLLIFTDGTLINDVGADLGTTLWDKWDFGWLERLRWRFLQGSAFADLSNNNNKVTGATVALRRTLLEHALPIEVPPGHWHDAWLALHACALGGLHFMPDRLTSYRIHPGQQVGLTRGPDPDEHAWRLKLEFQQGLRQRYPSLARHVGRRRFVDRLRSLFHRVRNRCSS